MHKIQLRHGENSDSTQHDSQLILNANEIRNTHREVYSSEISNFISKLNGFGYVLR